MLQCSKTFVPFCFPYIQLCFGVFACCSVAKSTVFFPRNWASLGQCLINNLVGFITQTWQPSKQTRFVEGEQEFQRGTESTATPEPTRTNRIAFHPFNGGLCVLVSAVVCSNVFVPDPAH